MDKMEMSQSTEHLSAKRGSDGGTHKVILVVAVIAAVLAVVAFILALVSITQNVYVMPTTSSGVYFLQFIRKFYTIL